MDTPWIQTIAAVVGVSLVSFVGVVSLAASGDKLRKWLLYMVSFAAGALLGDAFLHLLPEAMEECGTAEIVAIYTLAGMVFFFILEKLVFWRHCHVPTSENHPHPVGFMNLFGDGVHNFIDGVIIAGSFLVSPELGLATTLAVLLHEIPQEIGDFGILIHAGYTRAKAILYNFFSATLAIAGAVITLLIGRTLEGVVAVLLPVTIGGFIYIATADLLPSISKEGHTGRSFLQLLAFLIGIGAMAGLLLLE